MSASCDPQPNHEKLTKKYLGKHKSIFAQHDVLPNGSTLSYIMHGKKQLEGVKKDGGIFCRCCEAVVSPSVFEEHAGYGSRRKPYENIYTDDRGSLHELSLLENHKYSSKNRDTVCLMCRGDGDLLFCNNCPRGIHIGCAGLSSTPRGKWHCRHCEPMLRNKKSKVGDANAIATGRDTAANPTTEIMPKCDRRAELCIDDIYACAVCREHYFLREGFDDHTIMICEQCEKEYHVSCLKKQKIDDLKAKPKGKWFCCKQCSSIHSALHKLIEDDDSSLPETILGILKKKLEGQGSQPSSMLDIKWRLLRAKKGGSNNNTKWLSAVVDIFHDQFDRITIADASGHHVDLVPIMVHGKNVQHYDFFGMHSVVLMVNSMIVCAGIIRIFGKEVAELPLVATQKGHEGKGYFKLLFLCIEHLLSTLNVKALVLPATKDAKPMWISKFGFEQLDQKQLEGYTRDYQKLLMLEGTSVLRKLINKS